MIIQINQMFSDGNVTIKEFTIEDFRSISFMIENDSDSALYKKLIEHIGGDSDAVDKYRILFESRIKHVDENITFSSSGKNITINLDIWRKIFESRVKFIKKSENIDNFLITLDYPTELFFEDEEDLMISCIKHLAIKDKSLEFKFLDKEEKRVILNKLPFNVLNYIKEYIENNKDDIVLMESKLGLPEIRVNMFDNSAFAIIKVLYSYYSYDNITEILFSLSRRISDMSYLTTRTPRDISLLAKLYDEEELAKSKQQDN